MVKNLPASYYQKKKKKKKKKEKQQTMATSPTKGIKIFRKNEK